MAIDFQHGEYKNNIEAWKTVADICGSLSLNDYLIELNPADTSKDNALRNEQYKLRAVFYAVAGYTRRGMIGTMFQKPPIIEVPEALAYMETNCDGAGISIFQQSQAVAFEVVGKSRSGLCVSYPQSEGEASKADLLAMKVYPTIHYFKPEQIINWRYTTVGANSLLSLVVISETEEVEHDDYTVETIEVLRELALTDGVFTDSKWKKNKNGVWEVAESFAPTDGAGNFWEIIPFTFVGANDNAAQVDQPLMIDLAKINIGHFRNSADYEDSVWFSGQAQPFMTGVDANWVEVMRENKMYIGSRNLLGVTEGGTFGFASASPNPLVRQAMIDKLDLMVGLGARFIQANSAVKTATQAEGESSVQHSVLSLVAANITEAYTQCLIWSARYLNAPDTDIKYAVNQDFTNPTATAQELQAVVASWMQGAMPMSDMIAWQQKHGFVNPEKQIDEVTNELSVVDVPDLGE